VIVLAGADLVLPDRIVTNGSLLIESSQIVAIDPRPRVEPAQAEVIDVSGGYVVPGFIDVHVHGILGHDTLDGGDAVHEIASRLPRYGVTAFCPTTVACGPEALRGFCDQVRRTRVDGVRNGARVLPAHLESNFISPEFRGAQPVECLRAPVRTTQADARTFRLRQEASADTFTIREDFSADDILDVIAAARPDIGIVTVAPEIIGGLDLVRSLVAAGHRVSVGHSGADFETANAAIDAGARHATHLFNRMTPVTHRAPGLAGAVLAREEVAAELICDGYHVHPAMCRVAIAAKGADRVMAITDGTAAAGLAVGASARLGGRPIRVGERAAFLDDGTLAGSTLTMDAAFRNVVSRFGGSIVDAVTLCSTTPARELGLTGFGLIAVGATADVVVLDRALNVARTFVAGVETYRRGATA
jgi:N-acetylglucosamine-6-phosphate deacetylase